MWIRIILALVLIQFSEETCKVIRTLNPVLGYYYYYSDMSCTNVTPSNNLNSDILSVTNDRIKDLIITNSNIPELRQEMFLDVKFKNITIRAGVEVVQSRAFEECNVTSLILDHNDIKEVKDMSFSSSSIRLLSLQNNSLDEIKVNNFQGLSNLKKLNLKYNNIADVEEGSFSYLSSLEELDLSFNKLVELHFGLFDVTTLLQIIYLNNNLLKGLSDHIFTQCIGLRYVNIENNFLTIIDARYYPNSPLIVNASNNQLMSVDFSNLANANTINLNFNRIKKITGSLYNLPTLKFLYLNYNSLGPSIDPNTFHHLKNLTILDLDGNGLENIDIDMLNHLPILQVVSLASNNLSSLDFSKLDAPLIATLILSRNYLNNVKNLSRIQNLQNLDLSYNKLEEIRYDTFENLTHLVKLWLQYNSISALRLGCFKDLKILQELNLSHNEITYIEIGTFTGVDRLSTLDIGYNNLSHLDENIFHSTRRLARLNIAYNSLNDVDIRKIQSHLSSSLRELTLTGNNWTCNFLIDTFKNNMSVVRGTSTNVTNVFGIPCSNADDNNKQSNRTETELDPTEAYAKEISVKMTLIIVLLVALLVLFTVKFSFVKCCSFYTAARQFVYSRYRNEQEIQLT